MKLRHTMTIVSPPTGIVFFMHVIIFSIGPLAHRIMHLGQLRVQTERDREPFECLRLILAD